MQLAEEMMNEQNLDGPLVCFIHPIGTSKKMWEPVTILMKHSSFLISAIDLPGHGVSESLKPAFTMEGAADAILEHLRQKNKEVILVGHSIGGMVSQIAASKQPEFLKGLVLVSTLAAPPEAAKVAMKARAAKVLEEGMVSIISSTIERWFTPENIQKNIPAISLASQLLMESDPEVHSQAWEAIANFNSIPLLPKIKVPTLILVGEDDVSTPPSVAKVIHDHCPGSLLKVIPKVGHALPQEDPESVVAAINSIL